MFAALLTLWQICSTPTLIEGLAGTRSFIFLTSLEAASRHFTSLGEWIVFAFQYGLVRRAGLPVGLHQGLVHQPGRHLHSVVFA